jgi:hypothetical protein
MAGAGLSAQARTPDGKSPPAWSGLLSGMAEWCFERGDLDISEEDKRNILALVDGGFLLEAGQEIEDIFTRNKSKLQQGLKELLYCTEAYTGDAHRYVARIRFSAYLTTNYDTFIETAYSNEWRKPLMPFYESSIDSVLEEFRAGRPFILKLHGDVNDRESIKLGDLSYERLLHDAVNYRNCLHSIFSMSSVLFLGFGGSDPDLDGILSKVAAFDGHRRRHWMLVREGKFPTLKSKRLLLDKGIRVIEYSHTEDHSELVRFLEKLSTPAVATVNSADSGRLMGSDVNTRLEVITGG